MTKNNFKIKLDLSNESESRKSYIWGIIEEILISDFWHDEKLTYNDNMKTYKSNYIYLTSIDKLYNTSIEGIDKENVLSYTEFKDNSFITEQSSLEFHESHYETSNKYKGEQLNVDEFIDFFSDEFNEYSFKKSKKDKLKKLFILKKKDKLSFSF